MTRNQRLLIPARFVSDFGAFMSVVALSTFAYSLGHDPLVLGLVLALRVAGGILAGMVATPLFRRAPGAGPLVVLDLSRSAALVVLLLVLPSGHAVPALCAVAFVLGLGGSLFSIGLGAQLVRLVDEGRLLATNAWLSSVASVAVVLGSLSSGWIIALGGFRLAFEINAVTYAAAGALIVGLRFAAAGGTRASDPARRSAATLRAAVATAPALAFMLVVTFADTLGSAAQNVGFPILAALIAPASAGWVMGMLLAIWAVGKFAGAWLAKQYGRGAEDGGFQSGFFVGVLVMSTGFIATFFQDALVPALAWIGLAGLGDGVSEVCFRTRLQRADEDVQIPMFSATALAQNVGFVAGMLLCAPFFGWWSPGRVLLLFHGVPIVIAALGLVLWRRERKPLAASASVRAIDGARTERTPETSA